MRGTAPRNPLSETQTTLRSPFQNAFPDTPATVLCWRCRIGSFLLFTQVLPGSLGSVGFLVLSGFWFCRVFGSVGFLVLLGFLLSGFWFCLGFWFCRVSARFSYVGLLLLSFGWHESIIWIALIEFNGKIFSIIGEIEAVFGSSALF